MGGSNELVECFCGGAVAEGGSGAVVEFVGDGVEVGLVAGDGGSFGQVAADEPVGVFVGSSLPGAVGVSEEHLHAGVVGEALVAGHFPALVPGQCAHRLVGKALDAAGERVTDLVGFPTQRQGDDDQVAGGALNQGRARAGPVLADDQVAFPVTRDFPIRNVRALINQSHPNDGGFAPACGGFLAHPPARGQANAVFDERLLGVGVDPRVDRLVADRAALGVGRIIHRSHCATCLHAQASADLAGRAPLRQIKDHAAAENLIAVQEPLLRAAPGHLRCSPGILGLVHAARTPMAGDFTAHHRGATPNQVGDTRLGQARLQPRHDRRAILNTQHPTTPHDQPPNSITATRKLLTPYDTAHIDTARNLIKRSEKTETRDQIIANLTFGFWVQLLDRKHDQIWRQALHRAFRHPQTSKAPDAKRVRSLVNDVRQFRNRIAHHDYARDYDLPMLMSRVRELAELISPTFGTWLDENYQEIWMNQWQERPATKQDTMVVPDSRGSWETYKRKSAYICPAGRYFRQEIQYIAFYVSRTIQRQVPRITQVINPVTWTPEHATELEASTSQDDKKVADLIKWTLSEEGERILGSNFQGSRQMKVVLLTSYRDEQNPQQKDGHIVLPHEIPHNESGRGSGFVRQHRYASLHRLQSASTTADL